MSFKIFIIVDRSAVELCYFNNTAINGIVSTLDTYLEVNTHSWKEDSCKRYIATSELNKFKSICDKFGFTYTIACNKSKHSDEDVTKYIEEYELIDISGYKFGNKTIRFFNDFKKNFFLKKKNRP